MTDVEFREKCKKLVEELYFQLITDINLDGCTV